MNNDIMRQFDALLRNSKNIPTDGWSTEGNLVNNMIRVLIADDHPLIRTALRGTLSSAEDISVVGEAGNGDETLQRCRQLRPDVLLLDLSMPGPSALDIVETVCREMNDTRILVLTAFDDDAYVRPLMNAGIHGYLLKDEAPDVIVQAICTVARGLYWYSPVVLADLSRQGTGVPSAHLMGLAPDDQILLWAVVSGWNKNQIASMLEMPESTVRPVVQQLCNKLGVNAKSELVDWAQQVGIRREST